MCLRSLLARFSLGLWLKGRKREWVVGRGGCSGATNKAASRGAPENRGRGGGAAGSADLALQQYHCCLTGWTPNSTVIPTFQMGKLSLEEDGMRGRREN